ncbi:transcription factor IIIB 60 kDa subunit-like isoform X2 [Salvia miltiorrhiza]|uniref:transcription factor IIIB 60 kDa subunit-like isoform X2 n=1 Tax=Salvia miltiorrhiza TaxID=226208 RepID=UPI0025ABD7DE|nr:transcription factor IIIB 60 kDa subunit-like isoform X2 [Salvia miltiorrhiza]XP_057772904.1 transcription factor IIIB 60 kDa subunit-like isoform X2 [Salvia miltiorrhiza]
MPLWCASCAKYVGTDNLDGRTCCKLCGRVLSEDFFSEDATFVKTADGQARRAGCLVRSMQDTSESTQRTLDEAYYGINSMMSALDIDGGEHKANIALNLYKVALIRNFTRGRRKEQVQAACLYIMCRMQKKPYLLIDFSEHLRINVYVLGAVFLQLCKVLRLEENPLIQNLVDPSLFIHRFADRLFKRRDQNVSKTALLIVASMKRDWMQTGRKPSGLCGAALYISALAHGLVCSKSEIIKAVHICEATLTKRLIEFENTESGGLTIEEFEEKSKEVDIVEKKIGEDESSMKLFNTGKEASRSDELLCKHKGAGKPHFAYGLCSECYKDFMKLSGGLNGGSEPPAFQLAERKRIMAKEAAAERSENLDSSMFPSPTETNSKLLNSNTINDRMDACDFTSEESESLSDIDDIEVDVYINTEEEKNLKTTVWEEINREYLEEQAAKEASASAAKKAFEASFSNCSEDVEGARQLAAAAAAAAAQNRKEKRQKRAAELKNRGPPQTADEALKNMLDTKGLSDRIQYESLEDLFDLNPKRSKTEAEAEAEVEVEAESERDDYFNNNEEDPEYDHDQDYNDMNDF